MAGHFIIACRTCGDIISQCRCPAPNKEKRLALCFKCISKGATALPSDQLNLAPPADADPDCFYGVTERTRQALGLVADERRRQDEKWGGLEHDVQISPALQIELTHDYLSWARAMFMMRDETKMRRRLVQVAALALSIVEASLYREEARAAKRVDPRC